MSARTLVVLRLWNAIRDLFKPWICPLSGSEMAEAAVWIQQLSEGQKVLQPWAPGSGDTKHAAAVFDRFVLALSFLEETVPAQRFDDLLPQLCSGHSLFKEDCIALAGTSWGTRGTTTLPTLPTRPSRTTSSPLPNRLSSTCAGPTSCLTPPTWIRWFGSLTHFFRSATASSEKCSSKSSGSR